jgi:MSHA biogenesis protein MshG
VPAFAYRGRNGRGEVISGTMDAADQGAVADQLRSTGVTPVDIRATGARSAPKEEGGPSLVAQLLAAKVTLLDAALFSRQMYTLLKAGVPIMRALAGLQESAINPTLRDVIADLRASLDAGRELSTAMQRHPDVFSPFYLSVVRVGEATGQLDESFKRLFAYLEFEREVRERIKTALRYPMIVVVVIASAITIVNFAVIPAFARIFESHKVPLPLLTRILIGSSDFFLAYWPVMLVAIVGSVAGFASYIRSKQGRFNWDRLKLRIPIAGPIILKATLARFARSFALLSGAGVPIVQAMNVVSEVVDNAYLSSRIDRMRDGVERGESVLRTAVAAGVFTPVVLQMIAVGEETGELDDLLREVAEMYEREVDHEIKNLATAIEPIITIALGILVLMLALGIFLPMWDMGRVMLNRK